MYMGSLTKDAPVMRTASTAAKPCQGDSLEFYLITGNIYTEKRGTVVVTTVFDEELLEYVIGTCPKEFSKRDKKVATTPLNRNKQVAFRVNSFTEASGSKPRSNTKNNRILPAKSDNKKKVEAHPRNNNKVQHVWKETGKLFANVGYQWKPTGRKFTLGEQCPLTRFSNNSHKQLTRYKRKNKQEKAISNGIPTIAESQSIADSMQYTNIVLWYLDSGCSKHMMGNPSRLRNFVKKFIRTVRFGNDHFGAIMGYGDYVIDLEVAFKKHSCYVRDVDGVELLKGSHGSNLYTISVEEMMKSSPICLLSKASKNKSWLWHRRLNHLNFGTINDLARNDLVRGLPRLKFEKDYLCSACQLGKSKKYTHNPNLKTPLWKSYTPFTWIYVDQ
ncbi:integrase, catalytic region, zinc finger, CCHC-type containing protein [Tanacetum coccineum]